MAQQPMTYDAGVSAPFRTAARWLKVWVGMGVLAVIIVCLFLLAIISALRAIDKSLAVTDPTVGEIRGSTDPLAAHIDIINGALTNIDTALKPIPGQADTIIGLLTSIDRQAAAVDSSLGQTSSILIRGLSELKTVDGLLEQADDVGSDNKGVKVIINQANVANGILTEGERDTTNIDLSLNLTNGAADHVYGICSSGLTGLLGSNCKLTPPAGNPAG